MASPSQTTKPRTPRVVKDAPVVIEWTKLGLSKVASKAKTDRMTRADLERAALKSFEMVGAEAYLAGVAKVHPAVYLPFIGKLLSNRSEVSGADGKPIVIVAGSAEDLL
jgi:hypothetical protein